VEFNKLSKQVKVAVAMSGDGIGRHAKLVRDQTVGVPQFVELDLLRVASTGEQRIRNRDPLRHRSLGLRS